MRKNFIAKNRNKDHVIVEGKNNILLSAPHGVSQVRLGKAKFGEIGSIATALVLQEQTDSWLIAKTKNNNDDANFDDESRYKNDIAQIILKNKIEYLIDIHGLAAKRNCDINLGTHLGRNIKNNEKVFNELYKALVENGFETTIDQPFMAGVRTIAGSVSNKFPKLWTIQMEINCSITNKKENYARFKKLLKVLAEWIETLNN